MLIMTLLVRDEIDIIKDNIEHHLNSGVDFIIATDNGSLDGTRDVLLEYEKNGTLFLIDEPEQNYSQSKWVNRMGHMAYEKYKADYILHCDADEFWYSKSFDLTKEIKELQLDVMTVNAFTVFLNKNLSKKESYPKDNQWVILKDITNAIEGVSHSFVYTILQKVLLSTKNIVPNVSMGNHASDTPINKSVISNDIFILHYPIRSKEQFFKKIINGGKAYEDNKELPYGVGFHWRDWYTDYKNGILEDKYNALLLKEENIPKLIAINGIIDKRDLLGANIESII